MKNPNPIADQPLATRIILIVTMVAGAVLTLNSVFEFLQLSEAQTRSYAAIGYFTMFLGNCFLLWIMFQAKKVKDPVA